MSNNKRKKIEIEIPSNYIPTLHFCKKSKIPIIELKTDGRK